MSIKVEQRVDLYTHALYTASPGTLFLRISQQLSDLTSIIE